MQYVKRSQYDLENVNTGYLMVLRKGFCVCMCMFDENIMSFREGSICHLEIYKKERKES